MSKADSPKGDSYPHFVEQKGGRERRGKGGEEGRTNPNLFGGFLVVIRVKPEGQELGECLPGDAREIQRW